MAAKPTRFGSVRQLPSGRFQARYRDRGGARRSAPDTFATAADAWNWLVGIEADMIRGSWRDPDAGRVAFREWSATYLAGSVHKRATTRYRDASIVRRSLDPVFGDMALSDIEPLHVRAFVEALVERGLAASTIDTEYSLFRTIMNAAVDVDLITRSPCRGVKLPSAERKDHRRVTFAELARLVDQFAEKHQAMIWVAGLMGLRWSEVAGLKVGKISWVGTPSITVAQALADVGGRLAMDRTKTASSERTLPMPPALKEIIALHLAREGKAGDLDAFVFTGARGGPLRYSDFERGPWSRAVTAAGLEGLTFHGLRHSSAGLLRQLGFHTQYIARWLGHADDRITSKIYGWVPDDVDTAASAALDKLLQERPGHERGTNDAAGEGA